VAELGISYQLLSEVDHQLPEGAGDPGRKPAAIFQGFHQAVVVCAAAVFFLVNFEISEICCKHGALLCSLLIIDYSISKKLSLSRANIRNIELNIRNIEFSSKNGMKIAENWCF
jgi:hypothetical protein